MAADPAKVPLLTLQVLDRAAPPPPPDDAGVAAGIRRAAEFIRSRTVGMPPMSETAGSVPFLSLVPNEFPKPVVPGDMGLAAIHAAYSMAPWLLGPDQALVVTVRARRDGWPVCRYLDIRRGSPWRARYRSFGRWWSAGRTCAAPTALARLSWPNITPIPNGYRWCNHRQMAEMPHGECLFVDPLPADPGL